MTRLAMEATLQFVPIAPEVVPLIAALVHPAPVDARLLDVCAGTGDAAAALASAWGIARKQLYLNELADGRTAQCQRFTDHVLGADAIRGLQASRASVQVAWTNPPFGQQPKQQGGGRLEPLFFKRIVEDGGWLQPGGLHLMLAPEDVWATNHATLHHLARCYDQISLFALPDDYRPYRELLVVGVVRSKWRTGTELRERANQISTKLAAPLPILSLQTIPRYHIPRPTKRHQPMVWRDAQAATPEHAQQDVLERGGAWASKAHRSKLALARQDRRRIRPLFPLGKVAAALRIAEGDINNLTLQLGSQQVRIKGSTKKTSKVWQEERSGTDGATIINSHQMELREPVVVTLDTETAAVTRYSGDAGIAALMDIPNAAQQLLDAVATSAPPIYDMQLPGEVAAILDRIVSVSGRALPGYAPGYIPMQRHIIAAAYQAFRDPDPHTGKRRSVIGLGADMGCGKSGMAIGTAEVIRHLLPTNKNRAFTTLVIAPNHLIGELAQVLAHDNAPNQRERPPLPQWLGEWRDLLPNWYATILETPAQVTAFYQGAQADATTPRVGFIAFSKFSLSCGWEVAATSHVASLPTHTASEDDPTSSRAHFYQKLLAEEQREWDAHKQQKRSTTRSTQLMAERVRSANAAVEQAASDGPGVSDRTKRRDILFRCGHAFRSTLNGADPVPLWHYDGVFCPDCGRRIRAKDGVPHSHDSLRKAGMIRCVFCTAVLGQWSRKQDNVSDRLLPIFTDHAFLNSHVMEVDLVTGTSQRAVPWGERPTSNPRMALGDFILARGYAKETDLVITDEFHSMKGRSSARGRIWGRLISHAKRSVGLTGSPYGGKASTAYWMLQRMQNVFVRSEFDWDSEQEFVERMGVLDTITSQVVEEVAQTFSGKRNKSYVRVEERSGLTAELAAIMQSQFIFILLKQMGFLLPNYTEGVVFFDLPAQLRYEYTRLVQEGKAIIKQPGGKDALSSYLQSTLTYAMAPWKPVTIASKHSGDAYRPPELPADTLLPHHHWLAHHAATQAKAGRGMLVFAEHTNRLDILTDLHSKIQSIAAAEHGTAVKVAILRSTTVKPGARSAWFSERERDGTHVVLCHPGLVETGMNLIAWPEIVFAEPTYSLYRAMQARKRALRPTQTRDCNVTWLGYHNTMIAQALDIIGGKATAATLLNGDDLSSGLMQMDPGMSLLQELAQRVLRDEDTTSNTVGIAQQIGASGSALKQSMQIGVRDLVGIAPQDIALPDPTRIILSDLAAVIPDITSTLIPLLTEQPLSWREVLVRAKRNQRHVPAEDVQAVQYAFSLE